MNTIKICIIMSICFTVYLNRNSLINMSQNVSLEDSERISVLGFRIRLCPDLIQQVAFLHELLQEDDEDVGFGGRHRPGCVTLRERWSVTSI